MSNELNTPKILICPADTRTVADSFIILKNQNISYFASLDASEISPQVFLDGDRNLTSDAPPENGIPQTCPRPELEDPVHSRQQGNIGLAGGGVQQFQIPACPARCEILVLRPTSGGFRCRRSKPNPQPNEPP